MRQKDVHRVLVIKLGALGDVVQALGAMRAIRTYHKDVQIDCLTAAPFVGLLTQSGLFDTILVDEKPKFWDIPSVLKLRTILNNRGYDRVYDLQNNDRTFAYLWLFCPRPQWVGAAPGASHRNAAKDRSAGHAFAGHVQTLGLAGITDIKPDDLSWLTADLSGLNLPDRLVPLIIGSAPQHPYKRWPHFAPLAQELVKRGLTPILIGTETEKIDADKIMIECPQAMNLIGKTKLWDLPELARRCVAVIGNDTGPMHFMGPTGAKTTVLMGGHSNPKRHYPLGRNVKIIHNQKLEAINVAQILADL